MKKLQHICISLLGIYLVCVLPFLGVKSFAATSDIVQIDIGDATVPIRNSNSMTDGGKGVLDNGDALYYGVSLLSPHFQVYKYTHSTGNTEIVSVSSSGEFGNNDSFDLAYTPDGRYIAFYSYASNFDASDTNDNADVFVRDTQLGTTTRVSVATDGTEGDALSTFPIISANGRYVAFESSATNLVAGDTNLTDDIFVRDLQENTTARVSISNEGSEATSESHVPSISADGRYITFHSFSGNLVAGDTNNVNDVFVRDTQLNTTSRMSVVTGGAEANSDSYTSSISPNGRYVTFYSLASNLFDNDLTLDSNDIFIHDTQTGTTTHMSDIYTTYAFSSSPDEFSQYRNNVSTDGRYVAFSSGSINLVTNDTNNRPDIFVRDTELNTTTRVSVSSLGVQGNESSIMPSISADGRYVAFISNATNLVAGDTSGIQDAFVHDTQTGTTTRVSVATDGTESDDTTLVLCISADGRYVAFSSASSILVADDINGEFDIFVRDLQENTTTRVSVKNDGSEIGASSGNPVISADGRYVVFETFGDVVPDIDTNGQQDVFVRDTQLGTTTLVSYNSAGTGAGNGEATFPSISDDGRYISFDSNSSNLVTGDINDQADVFMRDMQTGTTSLVSIASDGIQTVGSTFGSSLSSDGRYVSFSSDAPGLVANDTNENYDVFVRDMQDGSIVRVPSGITESESTGSTIYPTISPDGSKVAFVTEDPINIENRPVDLVKNYFMATLPVATPETTPTTTSNSAGGILTELPPNKIVPNTEQPKNQNEVPVTNTAPVPAFVFVKNTRIGSRNVEVLELQKFLNKNGFIVSTEGLGSAGYETKYFGKATKKALINYQKANKLKADGTMNAKTIKFINKFNKQNL